MEEVHSLCFVSGDAGAVWLGWVGIGERFSIIYLPQYPIEPFLNGRKNKIRSSKRTNVYLNYCANMGS